MFEAFVNLDIHFIYLFIFTLGLSFGTGGALVGNVLFYTATEDKKITRDELAMIKRSRQAVFFGILLYAFAGVGLFTLSYESMLGLEIFYASMLIAMILVINALIFSYRHVPELERQLETSGERGIVSYNPYILISEVVSIVSWIFLNLYHSMHHSSIGFLRFVAMYLFALFIGTCGTRFIFSKRLDGVANRIMRIFSAGFLVASLVLTGTSFFFASDGREESHNHEGEMVVRGSGEFESSVYTLEGATVHNGGSND